MEKVVVAFENEKNCRRVKELLETSGTAQCVVCSSAAEVKRAVNKQRIGVVVCGYKFSDQSAEGLFDDLPPECSMLMLAVQNLLDLCGSGDIVKLATPTTKAELIGAVDALLQIGRRMERFVRPHRSGEEDALICQAKELLMDRRDMTEEQAHRFLQKRSMDTGARLADAARQVLREG